MSCFPVTYAEGAVKERFRTWQSSMGGVLATDPQRHGATWACVLPAGTIRLGEATPSYDAETEVSERAAWEHITGEWLGPLGASMVVPSP